MPSTPKHVSLYNAFGWEPPAFVHVGLLQDESGQKLSKRRGDIDISHYREQGVLPEALTNFVALLGWSHHRKNDLMSMGELIENVGKV
jgi:glutamyl-tRNA synthetase